MSAETNTPKANEARRILNPHEVKFQKVPAWLVKRLRAYRRERRKDLAREIAQIGIRDRVSDTVLMQKHAALCKEEQALAEVDAIHSWYLLTGMFPILCGVEKYTQLLDHWGSSAGSFKCCQHQENFVTEPYGFGSKEAKALDNFCAALGGLTWHISSNTWHNPGSTVRVVIHEVQKD